MKNKAIFTIVAKNYVGLAKVLGDSIKKCEQGVNFYVFIADAKDDELSFPEDDHTYLFASEALEISVTDWSIMSFQYTLTEFCTSVKPFCFKFLMEKFGQGAKLIYFDPDIFVFSPLKRIWDSLDKYLAVVTPHIVTPEVEYSGELLETNLLCSGLFNLGFLGVTYTSKTYHLMEWWGQRLKKQCFIERSEGLYTDQKWIDFFPIFLGSSLEISMDLGMNLAPWNFYERKVIYDDGGWSVVNRIGMSAETYPLTFVHFSGFDYRNLEVTQLENRDIPSLKNNKDILPLFETYRKALESGSLKEYFKYKYAYDQYDSGEKIVQFHRRIYRRLSSEGSAPLMPFSTAGSFYKTLQRKKLLVGNENNVDKLNERNYIGFNRKLRLINRAHILFFKLIGASRYFLLTKFLKRYYKAENQIALYDGNYLEKSFKNEILEL